MLLGSGLIWYSAFAMIYYNAAKGTFLYFGLIGILQVLAAIFWSTTMLIRFVYNLVNLEYLILKYDITTYSTITFYDPLGINLSEMDDINKLIYFEQLIFGNRRSMLYANIIMSIVLGLHPLTFIPSWFFLFQVPIGILFELVVYPFFPMYDTPYVSWTDYLYEIVNGTRE